MQFYKFSVPVAGSFPIAAVGSYIRYYKNTAGASGPTVEIRTDKGEAFLLKTNESARANRPFTQLTVTNFDGTTQIDGIFQVGDGEVQQNTFTGDVTVAAITNQVSAETTTAKTVTNADGQLVAANSSRRKLFVQNNDAAGTVGVRAGATAATMTNTRLIRPFECCEWPQPVTTEQIRAIGDAASNANIVVIEG